MMAAATTDEVSTSARSMLDTVVEGLPRVGIAVLIVAVGWGFGRLVRWLLHASLQRSQTPSFARVMSRLAGWLVTGLTVLVAVAVTFPSVKPVDLLAGLGFFSVAIGFAFQDILENTLAGVLLLFRQPFRSGDQIEVKEQRGTVEAITIRETRIKTFDGELVLVPNRDVYKSVIRVQTAFVLRRRGLRGRHRLRERSGEAIDVVLATLGDLEGVAAEPPRGAGRELGASTVDMRPGSGPIPASSRRSRPCPGDHGDQVGAGQSRASSCRPTSSPSRPLRASGPLSRATRRSRRVVRSGQHRHSRRATMASEHVHHRAERLAIDARLTT